MTDRLWLIRGTRKGKLFTFKVRAEDHNTAVRKASGMRYAVRDCVLQDEPQSDFINIPLCQSVRRPTQAAALPDKGE